VNLAFQILPFRRCVPVCANELGWEKLLLGVKCSAQSAVMK